MSLSPSSTMYPAKGVRHYPKATCFTAFALVFLCGMMAGAVAVNLGAHEWLHKKRVVRAGTRLEAVIALSNLKKELSLSPEQTGQMETILDDFYKYYHTVLSDGKDRILQILDTKQRQRFEQLLRDNKP